MPLRCRNILIVSLAALATASASAQQSGSAGAGPAEAPAEQPASRGDAAGPEPRREPSPEPSLEPGPDGARQREAEALPRGRDISLEVELRPWYNSPGGRLWLPGGGRDIDVEDLNIDSPRLSPAGRLRLEVDEWSFNLSAAHFSIDQTTRSPVSRRVGDIDISEGDALRTQMDFTTAELLVGNTFFQRNLYAFDYPQSRLGVELEALLGARVDRFDISLHRQGGGEASADEFFLMPLAAIESRLRLTRQTSLAFMATAGWNPGLGDNTAVTSDLIVRVAWEVTSRVELMAGYRITIQRMEAGEGTDRFEFNGSNAGLYGGVRIGF